MKSNIVVASLIRNEIGRFLPSALDVWKSFAKSIVVVDDGSTDGSTDLLMDAGVELHYRSGEAIWGAESPARELLWNRALACAGDDDWIFILDADMVPARDPRPLTLTTNVNGWAFRLFDLWSPDTYREDGAWQAHNSARVWMVKRPPDRLWHFNQRGVHCGHFPQNLDLGDSGFGIAPMEMSLLHYAYSDKDLREAKAAQYISIASQLEPQELAHAQSILAPATTRRLPFRPRLQLIRGRANDLVRGETVSEDSGEQTSLRQAEGGDDGGKTQEARVKVRRPRKARNTTGSGE